MPRVSIKRKDYMIVDFSRWLVGKMREKNLRQVDVAKLLGIDQPGLSRRIQSGMKGRDSFSQGQMITLFKELEATDEEILRLTKF